YSEPLRGRTVVVLRDNDESGRKHVYGTDTILGVLPSLHGKVRSLKLVELPGLPLKGDVSDYLLKGGMVEDLFRLVKAAPAWEPEKAPEGGLLGFLGNPPQVRPISVALRPVPPLNEKLIPGPFRAWLKDIAARACCPLDLPAMAAVVSVAATVGRKVAIRPKRYDDWTVVPNLWGMGVLPPGWLKSHCLEGPKTPLARLEIEAQEEHTRALGEFAIAEAVAATQIEAAKGALKAAAKRGKDGVAVPDESLRNLAAETLAKPTMVPPTLRRYIVNDATVEKLGELLAENPNGLLLFRDELMGFLKSLEKQGHEGDRAFYLESWNGTGSYTYDRIGRGTLFIPSNTVSILGGIQPGKLAAYVREHGSGDDDDGFISRFQLAVYPDTDQPFVNVDSWPDTAAKNLAYSVFGALADLDPGTIGAMADDQGPAGIPYLRFADDAQPFFDDWRLELETEKIRSSREASNLIAHLAKYRSLMPSLALLFHLVEVAGGEASGPVSLKSAKRAAAWCDYLEAHARRIYQAAFDGDPEPAQRLVERLKESLPNPFAPYQVVQKGWKSLDTIEAVNRAIAMAEDHGWVYRDEIPPGPKGGRPKIEIHFNPRLLEGGVQ
ncbi:MAG: YfjI family protein, partial [Planctomycetaceae bacterium]